jgi:hypothetical protein
MRSSIKQLYCTPLFKIYYDFEKSKNKIFNINKLLNKKNVEKKNKSEIKSSNLNSYKYMYNGLVKK